MSPALRLVLLTVALAAAGWLVSLPQPLAADPLPGESAQVLVDRLGHREYAQREAAMAALLARGESALPAVRTAATGSANPEIRWRANRLWNRILHVARVSKTTGMELALIVAGDFEMGSPGREPGRRADETLHTVAIPYRFLIGTYEVTQAEYEAVTGAKPSWFAATGSGKDAVSGVKTDKFPVESVNWFEAVEFCNALSKKDGYPAFYTLTDVKKEKGAITAATVTRTGGSGYRLPTEAEWEYCCRAGTATAFHFGPTARGGEGNFKTFTFGGYGGREERPSKGRTTAVGEYRANRWGLHDMHGNAAEWCDDWYDAKFYENSPADAPTGPEKGTHKVVRGGSWLVTDASCRSASRTFLTPDVRERYVGFRVARTP